MIIFVWAPLDAADRDFYSDLYQTHRDGMWKLANYYVHDPDIADDVVQTAFFNLMRSADRFRAVEACKQKAYITATVRNAALDQLRRRKIILLDSDDLSWVVQPEYRTEYDYIDSLCSLPVLCKDAVRMRYTFGLTCKEIGQRMGIKENTVQKRIDRGLKQLGEEMAQVAAYEMAK